MSPDRLSSVLAALYRRRLAILLIAGATLASALVFSARLPKVFVVRATVFVPKDMPRLSLSSETSNIPQGPVLPDVTEGTRVGMTGLINSGAVHDRVAEVFAERGITLDPRKVRRNVFGDIDNFQSLVVYAYDRDPRMAVALANTFVQAFEELMSRQVARAPEENLRAFEQEVPRAEQALQAAQAARADFLAGIGTADLEAEFNLQSQQRERILDQLQDLDVQERQVNAEGPALDLAIAGRPEFVLASKQHSPNSAYYQVLRALADARADLVVRLLTYTSEHPIVRALNERVRLLEARAAEEARTQYVPGPQNETLDQVALGLLNQKLQSDVTRASLQPMRETLQVRLAQIESDLALYPERRTRLERLDLEAAAARDYLEQVSARTRETALQLARGFPVTYTDEHRLASEDDVKQIPTRPGILFFSTFAGLAMGVFVALLMEMLARMRANYPF
ncbi:MAG: hypothetical protein EYC70_05810 [Planctomycetota bacterium]|nr:MAG: hypothetical protein EYC70_05810 [Planctomycetota bacterium]